MQYSLFTHGTALEIEDLTAIAGSVKVGWGTAITLKPPAASVISDIPVAADDGPGTWFHLPLPSTFTTFGWRAPQLKSVTLLFEASNCRIRNVHVWDGADIVEEFNFTPSGAGLPAGLTGDFLRVRDAGDINPESPPPTPNSAQNTFQLKKPHKVFSAIGISFFAYQPAHDLGPASSPARRAVLTVSAGGAQFIVQELSPFRQFVAVLRSITGLTREP